MSLKAIFHVLVGNNWFLTMHSGKCRDGTSFGSSRVLVCMLQVIRLILIIKNSGVYFFEDFGNLLQN